MLHSLIICQCIYSLMVFNLGCCEFPGSCVLELDTDTLLAVAYSFPCFMLRKAKSLCDACVLNFAAGVYPADIHALEKKL